MRLLHLNRRVHYWLSLVVALPLVVMAVTGLLLQFKKQLPWVQPTEQRGSGGTPSVTLDRVLEICRGIPQAEVKSWDDISRIDVRPSRGMLKVSTANSTEVQIDLATGEVLQVAHRRSDMLEAIHDGSWFHTAVKFGVFVPAGVSLLVLWLTGLVLFIVPYLIRARRAKH